MLHLNPNNKPVRQYYVELEEFDRLGIKHEMAVRAAFQHVLEHCCRQVGWTLEHEYKIKTTKGRSISVDGGLVDTFRIPQAFWEAKDSEDDLAKEIEKKFALGYPRDNIVFQSPTKAILWQGGTQIYDADITKPETLVLVVKELFSYKDQTQADWERAIEEFKPRIPSVAKEAIRLIEVERKENPQFIKALVSFADICRTSVNPNLSDSAIEEMLVQHLLTERIFRKVFHNSDFTDRNIIAKEIERVIHALTARKFSKEEFLKPLDHFYGALERRAETLNDYSQQQTFVNTVYEKFFQGFAVKQADTHGIVYTPQAIVNFMVRSVEEILKKEFGKSLSDEGVHIIDPFVGTGNFITRIMQEIKGTALPRKYANELHCNEVMLLPYYIASMSIEHAYYERTGEYKPFEGICLVDTFELAEDKQPFLFTEENTDRVERLKQTKLFVVIANPPYNAWQLNENDNNKNRKYKVMDKRVKDTYSKDGTATNKIALSDPYVKAIRWASDKILENGEGIIALVTNDSFVDQVTFDGMRKHLEEDFDLIYVLDLGGNVRKNPKLSGTTHNVFGIQVGVSINLFVKKKGSEQTRGIFHARVDEYWRKEDKFAFLEKHESRSGVEWQDISPDKKHTWLTKDLHIEFDSFVPLGSRREKMAKPDTIFRLYCPGVKTNRDEWAYNFNLKELVKNVELTIQIYNEQVLLWQAHLHKMAPQKDVTGLLDAFVSLDSTKVSWSESLKKYLQRGAILKFEGERIRKALYRPFVTTHLYFDPVLVERRYQMPQIFPTEDSEHGNRVIIVPSIGSSQPAFFMSKIVPDLNFFAGSGPVQCFPFFAYDKDGTNRRENISDWALDKFRAVAGSDLTKWDVFHYIYGLLHSPQYAEVFAANLRRELPRVPLPKDQDSFCALIAAGKRLAELHVNYESQPQYPLQDIETPDKKIDWHVQKMRLTKDKTAIVYNDWLTLAGIPPEVFEYRLGNRSALEWIIDRYQVRVDKRSGIVNDPNRPDDQEYIVCLVKKIVTVSLETVKIVNGLAEYDQKLFV